MHFFEGIVVPNIERETLVSDETWTIAAAGLPRHLEIATSDLCKHSHRFRFTERMSFKTLRIDELREADPDIVLIDESCVGAHVLHELSSLHEALPSTRTLVIGDAPSSSKLLEGLRVGVWGVLARARAVSEIGPAVRAIVRNELWFSRGALCGLLMLALSSPEPSSTEAQTADLPQLTMRENAVMQRVIQGYSNKEIARTLGITDHTVKVHLHHIYGKLHLRRVDLLLGHRNGANQAGMTT